MLEQQLGDLKALHERGLITDEIYAERQRELLGSPSAAPAVPIGQARQQTPWIKTAIIVTVVLAALWGAYQFADRETKVAVNALALQTPVTAKLVPWPDRAEPALRPFLSANADKLATAIQGITHPSGTNPELLFDVTKVNDHVQVTMTVTWQGGVLGKKYETTVVWELSENNHISTSVLADSALIPIAPENKEQLDVFFRTKVYPAAAQRIKA